MAAPLKIHANIKTQAPALTAPGQPLELSPALRNYAVVTPRIGFLCLDQYRNDPEITSLPARANAAGIAIPGPRSASLEEIAAAYANRADAAEYATHAKRRFLAYLQTAADREASDLQLLHRGDQAYLRLRVGGAYTAPVEQIAAADAIALWNAAFNASDTGDSIATSGRPMQTAITSRRRLPAGVAGARLQFNILADGAMLTVRLIYSETRLQIADFASAGFTPAQIMDLHGALASGSGQIHISGPTEHGKSTSLNIAIQEYAKSFPAAPNVVSVEDPPETLSPVINAIAINRSLGGEGEAYDDALKAALRVAPDALKIGEVRDTVTAQAAWRAAEAGALVFTTIHTASALDIPFRLRDLGLGGAECFGQLHRLWAAQRLVPRACPECAIPTGDGNLDGRQRAILRLYQPCLRIPPASLLFRGPGCPSCAQGTGRRRMFAEVLRPDDGLMTALMDNRAKGRSHWIANGGQPLTLPAWEEVEAGRITLDDYARFVAGPDQLSRDQAATPPGSAGP